MAVRVVDVERPASVTVAVASIVLAPIVFLGVAERAAPCSRPFPHVPPAACHVVAELPVVTPTDDHTRPFVRLRVVGVRPAFPIPFADTGLISKPLSFHAA